MQQVHKTDDGRILYVTKIEEDEWMIEVISDTFTDLSKEEKDEKLNQLKI